MKTIIHPETGKTFKFGRIRPTHTRRQTSLRHMMDSGVIPQVSPPKNTYYRTAAAPSLSRIYLNDRLGCCVVSGGFHVRGLTSFNSGQGVIFTDDQTIHDYSAIGGYDPSQTQPDGSNPTDQGCDENTALAYWQTSGFPDGPNSKLIRSIAIDANNEHEVRIAMDVFENLYICAELPDEWISPFPSGDGFVWDKSGLPNPENGHCFVGSDLKGGGIKICTWGMTGTLTRAGLAYYSSPANGGQLFTLLTPDIVSRLSQKSPSGYDIATLEKFMEGL